MSKFEDRVREVVDPLVRDIEQMFYDDNQAPDLGPILESLNKIKRNVEDIKFELDPVNRESLSNGKNDNQSDDSDNPSREDDFPFPSDVRLIEDARSLAERYYEALQSQGPEGAKHFIKSLLFNEDGSINPSGFPNLMELMRTAKSPQTISSLLQHYGIPRWIADLLADLISEVLENALIRGATKALVPLAIQGPSTFQIGKKVDQAFTDTMDTIDSTISQLEDQIKSIQTYQSDILNPYLRTIFDKIVECCSKEVLEEIKDSLINVEEQSDEINFKISSLQPTTNLNNTLNVVTSNKAILAKLRDIRSLL